MSDRLKTTDVDIPSSESGEAKSVEATCGIWDDCALENMRNFDPAL